MNLPPEPRAPLVAFGMTSLVLGFLSTVFFFLPILGIPIALFGLVCGVIGMILSAVSDSYSRRWALSGLALSLLGLGVNVALINAPEGYHLQLRQSAPPPPPRDWHYVAPPA